MPHHTLVTLLAQAAQREVHCNCSDVTRIQVGPLLVPVGPLTVIFALVVALLGPAWLLAQWRKLRNERAARAVMMDAEGDAPRP
ncbi:MAG: hypothetical protein JNK05_11990 [Myxococcales bacterium]|nr:hypothetical protein [Myxococcales bacterium]